MIFFSYGCCVMGLNGWILGSCCMEFVVVLRLLLMVFSLMFSFFSYSCCVMGLYGRVFVEVVVGVP